MKRKTLAPFFAAAALVAVPAFAAHTTGKLTVTQPPPMASAEDTPAQREGHIWAPGYWHWTGTKYEWTKGHFVTARKGYRYEAPRWVQEPAGWTLYPEKWVMDEDDKEKTVSRDSSLPKR